MYSRAVNAITNSIKETAPWKCWTAENILSEDLISSLHESCCPPEWPEPGKGKPRPVEESQYVYQTGSFETPWWEDDPRTGTKYKVDGYKGFRLYFRKGIENKDASVNELLNMFTSADVRQAFESITKKKLDNTVAKICYTQEKPGWKMHIHDDHPSTCKLTFLIYLPVLPIPEDCQMGTSIYNQDATLHHRAPYVNNTGQFFIPCSKKFRRTLHGFDGKIVEDRRFLLIQYLTHTDIDVNNPKIPIEYDGIYGKPKVMDYDTSDTLWVVK